MAGRRRVEVLREEYGSIRYRVFGADDSLEKETKLPANEVRTASQERFGNTRKSSLRKVIEAHEGIEDSPASDDRQAEIDWLAGEIQVVRNEVGETLKGYAAKEHPHPEFATLANALKGFQARLDKLDGHVKTLQDHARDHKHDVPEHPHPSLQAQLDAQGRDLKVVGERELPLHPHPEFVTIANLSEILKNLDTNIALAALRQSIADVDARIPVVPQMPVVLSTSDVEAIVKRELDSRRTKAHFREVSSQEVAGKQRYVVEEV